MRHVVDTRHVVDMGCEVMRQVEEDREVMEIE